MCGGRQEKHITLCSKLIFLGICDMSAAMYYGYTDRAPGVWHIAVDNKSARNYPEPKISEEAQHEIKKIIWNERQKKAKSETDKKA